MKTEELKDKSRFAMEQVVLEEVPYITNFFLGKGLINVVVERLKSSELSVVLTFKEDNRFTRVRASVDKDLCFVVSVVNHDRKLLYVSYSKYESDFKASLYHQCNNLADLPF